MIRTIFAIIGILAVIIWFIKIIARAVLRMEHESDLTYYQIFENGTLIWESGFVKEFTSEETNAFQNFCKEWSKHPGATAYWNRVKEK